MAERCADRVEGKRCSHTPDCPKLQPTRSPSLEAEAGSSAEQGHQRQVSGPLYLGSARNGRLNCRDGRCGGCPRCMAEEFPSGGPDDADYEDADDR
jgi:hypothetical protein